ncbi:hypothetical protein AB5I41_17215 [Sphingomonas sp. MMS24-JH45]
MLRLLAASLLTPERIVLDNYPDQLLDAIVHVGMLEALGKKCTVADGSLTIEEASASATSSGTAARSATRC